MQVLILLMVTVPVLTSAANPVESRRENDKTGRRQEKVRNSIKVFA